MLTLGPRKENSNRGDTRRSGWHLRQCHCSVCARVLMCLCSRALTVTVVRRIASVRGLKMTLSPTNVVLTLQGPWGFPVFRTRDLDGFLSYVHRASLSVQI